MIKMVENIIFLWKDNFRNLNGIEELKNILISNLVIYFGIFICLENFFFIEVFLKSLCFIYLV